VDYYQVFLPEINQVEDSSNQVENTELPVIAINYFCFDHIIIQN